MLIKRFCVCLLPQQPNFPREQLQSFSALYLASLQSGNICYIWLSFMLGKVTTCLQGTPAAHNHRDLSFLKHLLLIFLPLHLMHLDAFAEQNTDYHSIFILISLGAVAELFCISDSDLSCSFIPGWWEKLFWWSRESGRWVFPVVCVCICKNLQLLFPGHPEEIDYVLYLFSPFLYLLTCS